MSPISIKRIVMVGSAVAAAGLLAGCGGGGGGGGGTPVAAARFEDQFGTGFGAAYRQAPDRAALTITDSDVIAVNPAADPVALP